MKVLNVPVNATSSDVAEDILRTHLKRDLRPGGTAYGAGFRQYELVGSVLTEDRVFSEGKVALEEKVADPTRLHTYLVTVEVYRDTLSTTGPAVEDAP